MKTVPDEPNLLDDVLNESVPVIDSLGPMLRAVRARRRRRQAAPVLGALLLAALAWSWLNAPWRSRSGSEAVVEFAYTAPAVVPTGTVVQRVNSRALASSELVKTKVEFSTIARVQTGLEPDLRASDGELLALAGGRGVGLFRFPGHTELLIAGTP